MKSFLKAALVVTLVALVAVGFVALRNQRVRRDTRKTPGITKGIVNEEIIKSAERLAETLRKVKHTAETNNETKK